MHMAKQKLVDATLADVACNFGCPQPKPGASCTLKEWTKCLELALKEGQPLDGVFKSKKGGLHDGKVWKRLSGNTHFGCIAHSTKQPRALPAEHCGKNAPLRWTDSARKKRSKTCTTQAMVPLHKMRLTMPSSSSCRANP